MGAALPNIRCVTNGAEPRVGQYSDPVRVVAFNCAEHWAEDASEDIAREIMRRLHLAGDELPSSLEAFVERYLGPDRQLTLRLA
jgi:hypothetical protein